MLLSGRKLRPDNNACQGLKPLDPLRISSALRCARLSEMLRSLFERSTVPCGLSCRLSLFACLTRLRLVLGRRSPLPQTPWHLRWLGRRCTPPDPLPCALRLPGARLILEVRYAPSCR